MDVFKKAGDPLNLFDKSQTIILPPAVTSPAKMPTPDDDAVLAAKKKSLAAQRARSGRASTILADEDTLG